MRYAAVQTIDGSRSHWHRCARTEDALDPIRGILLAALISIVGFWLPLALTLSR
ncbi:MAG TPA: hypothetical protein VJ891_00675 [Casimicrobiaceae bacterium]|nr:hypothetical protein [Casimicrobiaceae bacterium]